MIIELIDADRKMRGRAPVDKVIAYSMPVTESGCWIWLRSLSPSGYGQVFSGSMMEGAHRFSWRAFNGEIPEDACVLHKCDVRCCVNPDHLYVGDHQQNMDDMNGRGRGRYFGGEENAFAKLSDQQVTSIRVAYASGKLTQALVAEQFGCSQSLVSKITRGEHRH